MDCRSPFISGSTTASWPSSFCLSDIAFALGMLALAVPRAPNGLKIFLAALAIVDDMGAVLVIALLYTGAIASGALGGWRASSCYCSSP
jgi:NhaA family Na+:H+ antiporter